MNKLFAKLKTCSKKEVGAFLLFLSQDNSRQGKVLMALLTALRKQLKKTVLDEKKLYQDAFSGKAYNLQLLRVEMSKLNARLDLFWHYRNIEGKTITTKINLLEELSQRKLSQQFDVEYNRAVTQMEKHESFSEEHLMNQAKLQETAYEHFARLPNREEDQHLLDLDVATDQLFIFKKLSIACDMLNRKNILQKEYSLAFAQHIIQYIENERPMLNPLNQTYYCLFNLLKGNNVEAYEQMKETINRFAANLGVEEAKEVYASLQNFCIQQINKGDANFRAELFMLYQQLIESRLIFNGEKINVFDYKNIATIGIQLKEYDWVERFTEIYTRNLDKDFQEGARAFNLARIHFQKGAYRNALRNLLHVNFPDAYYELGSRLLIAKIYFEQDEIPLMEAVLSSFKMYVSRNRVVSNTQKEIYLNFIKYASKLCRYAYDARKLKKLYAEVEQIIHMVDKEWILDKIKSFY